MKAKTLTILVLVLLQLCTAFPVPVVYASPGPESLYVNSFDSTDTGWTEVGSSPYLHNSDTDYVYATLQNQIEDWSGFANSTGSGTINSVYLYVETKQDSWGDDQTTFSLKASGVTETVAGTITPDNTGYTWQSMNVSSILDMWTEIDPAELKLICAKVGPAFAYQYVRRAYLYVDYTVGALS